VEVPILKQGAVLIATFQAALSDADLNQLRMGLVQQVVKFRSRAVIVDVTAMDVMDSFASRTLREVARRGNRDRRNSTRSGFCDGAAGLNTGRRCDRAGLGRGSGLLE
jgi:hypothetical protein